MKPAADQDEEKSGSAVRRRQSTTVEECEEHLKAAIRAHDTAALAHGIADAERLQVAESSVVLKTARRTHDKWVSEAADRRKVRAIELKAKAALDAHDQGALQLTLQEASEAGILAEQCEWLQSAKTTYESWLSEANAWRSQVSRRMGVIKLVKVVLADTDVEVDKARGSRSAAEDCRARGSRGARVDAAGSSHAWIWCAACARGPRQRRR